MHFVFGEQAQELAKVVFGFGECVGFFGCERGRVEIPLLVLAVKIVAELLDRKSTRLNSSHEFVSRMPSSA